MQQGARKARVRDAFTSRWAVSRRSPVWPACAPGFWDVISNAPIVPFPLAFAGLPFLQLHAALLRRPPLYTRNSLHLVRDCPADVDHGPAEAELGYVRRSLEHSVRDALHWFQDRGMLA